MIKAFFRKKEKIKIYYKDMIKFKEVFTYIDQPVTCPKCGHRTKIVLNLSHTIAETQVYKCLSPYYQNKFVTQTESK